MRLLKALPTSTCLPWHSKTKHIHWKTTHGRGTSAVQRTITRPPGGLAPFASPESRYIHVCLSTYLNCYITGAWSRDVRPCLQAQGPTASALRGKSIGVRTGARVRTSFSLAAARTHRLFQHVPSCVMCTPTSRQRCPQAPAGGRSRVRRALRIAASQR
jgi:hypothetical protein